MPVNGDVVVGGSSPLTRGKRCVSHRERGRERLIPAHAGKTSPKHPGGSKRAAHPRSRGENGAVLRPKAVQVGSSPLTRGKRSSESARRLSLRLIPAHAGKTPPPPETGWWGPAHPRSRGENPIGAARDYLRGGSSPLTRGKQVIGLDKVTPQRLIPAHAGKTPWPPGLRERVRAHPRSRGENRGSPASSGRPTGSSPLTRGKRDC